MRFAYYERLSTRDQRIYRQSDRTHALLLPDIAALGVHVEGVRAALTGERRVDVQRATGALANAVLAQLATPEVRVRVLSVRPSSVESELHGLYERDEDDGSACITVWMRTAAKKRVVAFRTFVRTLLHEVCHHLDYDHLKLADSFHTQGFFQREASLARQLLGERSPKRPQQLELPLGE
jgi:hypothetical protein